MDLNQDPPSPQDVILPIKLISPLLKLNTLSGSRPGLPAKEEQNIIQYYVDTCLYLARLSLYIWFVGLKGLAKAGLLDRVIKPEEF